MPDANVFGDAEAAVCAMIRDYAGIEDFDSISGADVQVSTDLIGFTVGLPWVRVVRTGGVPIRWMHLDNPAITVDVYAASKAEAYDLACAARRAVFAARGAYTGNGLDVYDVADAEGLAWAPDETTGPRYTFALAIVTRPSA